MGSNDDSRTHDTTRSHPSLRALFEAAIACEATERQAFLEQHCADPLLRAQVEALLRADEEGDEVMSSAEIGKLSLAVGPPQPSTTSLVGSRIGPFTLVEKIGEGGASIVFHATREVEGATQHVALKLMRHGLYSAEAQLHFRREQRALIQLRHPNIARMIEGGVSDAGLPYIALELVHGRTITGYALDRNLSLNQRLQLFLHVCNAVDAAHRALIVHRDLKPSNVLVTDDGEVKLLDFGIAKLLADEDADHYTQLPSFTPAYAAPEQRINGPITTATDVFALGVILGELVTGKRINDGSGRTPSARVDDVDHAGPTTTSRITRRQVRGDLDAIILKSLDEDPQRRYSSAGALASDIERLLAGQPVSAQIPTRWYRARKFVQRHRIGVASSAAFLLALMFALGFALHQARLAREQAQNAENASVRANTTLGFIVSLLQTASASLPLDQRPTPEALVATAAKDAREKADLDPAVRAQLLLTLAEVARSNGDYKQAEPLINEAIVRMHEQGLIASSPQWIAALVAKANLLHDTDRIHEADDLMKGLLPVLDGVETEGAVSALMMYSATRAYSDDVDSAAEFARQALAKAQRVFGPDSENGIQTALYLGHLFSRLGNFRDSEATLDDVLQRWRKAGLPRDELYARSLYHLARAKYQLEHLGEVESIYLEALQLMRSIHDGPYFRVSQGLRGYADFLMDVERHAEARVALDEAVRIDSAETGGTRSGIAYAHMMQTRWHAEQHDFSAADRLYRETKADLLELSDDMGVQPELAWLDLDWSAIQIELGQREDAAQLLSQAGAAFKKLKSGSKSAQVQIACTGARLAMADGKYEEALLQIDRGLELREALDIPATRSEIRCQILRGEALLALRRLNEARQVTVAALARQQQANPLARSRMATLLALRARIETQAGDSAAATAAVNEARALDAAPELLSVADRETLGLPVRSGN